MRSLLVLWLAVGMAPGLGEVAESAVHLVTAGHLAHTDADHGDLGDQGPEHGCGTTQHHCGCCASQVATAAPFALPRIPVLGAREREPASTRLASLHEPAPPSPPPITS